AYSPIFRTQDGASGEPIKPTHRPFLLYVGNRRDHKNFSWLVEAFALWRARREVDLVVAGAPWLPAEQDHLRKLGIDGQVHLVTGIDDKHLCSLYNQAAAFVFPSLYEGFGLPVLEAMACGCPVVASRIPSTVEVAGQCPIYFEIDDIPSLHVAFERALSEGRNSVRTRHGLEWVKRYSWDKTAADILNIYHSLGWS
ncbi:MAG: glycosyltransferase family 4 protein, partial [Synergistales bacterium]|nr:glycosyltransferase family 4 protein [Synergistales bacterium]